MAIDTMKRDLIVENPNDAVSVKVSGKLGQYQIIGECPSISERENRACSEE